jgi:pyruvate dehydrogenase E1 component beta subunit
MYAAIPGLKVVTPFTPYDAKGLIKSAIRDEDPVLIMESEKMYGDKGDVPDGEFLVPIGVANIRRTGTDCTVVSFGKILKTVHEAADVLAAEGLEVEIVDLRTIRPLDLDTIVESVKKTGRLVIVDESFPVASMASEVSYRVQRHAFDYLDAPIRRVCQSDTPFAFSTALIEEALPQVTDVVRAIKDVAYVA